VPSAGCFRVLPPEQQPGAHLPSLLHQHVERAARGAHVHDFQSDARTRECTPNGYRRKLLPIACAKQNELGFRIEERLKVAFDQIFDFGRSPIRQHCVRRQDATSVKHLFAHAELARCVRPYKSHR
jgi:hypothetical protein